MKFQVFKVKSQILGVFFIVFLGPLGDAFCIESNGDTLTECLRLWGHQVQNMKVLKFWILKPMVKTL